MKQFIWLWGGSQIGRVGEVVQVEERNKELRQAAMRERRDEWERTHPGQYLQLMTAEEHPDVVGRRK